MAAEPPVLAVENLGVDIAVDRGAVHAVRDASFEVQPGTIHGIVGESGSGKSVTGMAIMGLLDRRRTTISGKIVLDGDDIAGLPETAMRDVRGDKIGMVFQEPMTALNPLMRVESQVAESLRRHRGISRRDARDEALRVLASVGIPNVETKARCFPHELSGGLRQRAMIAVAIACRPRLVIADEPTTALDVTIQAQVLGLLRELVAAGSTSVILITHDLGVVAEVCDHVTTMYAGETVEHGPVRDIVGDPAHPYTGRLLKARPRVDGWGATLESIPGRVPNPEAELTSCAFMLRCDRAEEACAVPPPLSAITSTRAVRCVIARRERTDVGS